MSGRSVSARECVYKRSSIVMNNRLGPLSEGIPRYCIVNENERLMVKARPNKAHITYKLTEGGEPSIDSKRHPN